MTILTNVTNDKRDKGDKMENLKRLRTITQAYSPSYPCPIELFVGRRAQLDFFKIEVIVPKLTKRIAAPTNVAFLGVWGIGKTSILKYIVESKEFLKKRFLNLPIIQEFETINDLLSKALENIAASVSKIKWLKTALGKKIENIGLGPISLRTRVDRGTLIQRLIRTWDTLENAGIQHCSIVIDDFHRLTLDDMFSLRSVFQHLPSAGCNYSLVTSCIPQTFEPHIAEPVSRFFYKYTLGSFTPKEIEECIRKPAEVLKINLDFDKYYVDELARITLGHPYFVKFITKELAKRYIKVTANHIDKHFADLLRDLGREKFENDYNRASPGEQRVLNFLAKEKKEKFEARELRIIKNYAKYIERLTEKELLIWEGRGIYSIYHPLFLEWVQKFGPLKVKKR